MALRFVSFALAFTLCGQDTGTFPPSRPYRVQLSERGPVREIGLRDAISLALMNNLEIEMEGYNRDISQASTRNARSVYDPVAGLSASILSNNLPVTSILQTGLADSQITRSWTANPSLQDNLPGGGTAALSLNLTRVSTNGLYVLVNPVYTSTLGLTITQPLWRGFLRTYAERQIVVARLNEHLTESQFRQKVAYVVEQAIAAYWRLAVVQEYYETQRQARDVAVLEYEDTRKHQAEAPDAAALAARRSDVASHDQTVAQAALQTIQAANALKRLLAASILDPLWGAGLVASDRPEVNPPSGTPIARPQVMGAESRLDGCSSVVGAASGGPCTLEEAIRTALDRRPELDQLRLQLRQSDAEMRYARQETKPAVNLRLELQAVGDAGRAYAVMDGVVSRVPDPTNIFYGGPGKAYQQAFGIEHPSIAAGLEIRLPLRNGAANSQLATVVASSHKLQSQLRAVQEDILVEVRNAWETISVQKTNVDTAAAARRTAEERVAAERSKAGGDSGNIEVRRAERDLSDSRTHELQAAIDYQLARVALEKATDTLIDAQQIVLTRRKAAGHNENPKTESLSHAGH